MRMKRPSNWREIVRPAYEEGGVSIGRMIMYDRSKELEIWSLIGPADIWPRWYLYAFATLYREDNPKEYERQKRNKCNAKHRAARKAGMMEESRKQAREELGRRQTRKDAGTET